MKNLTAYLTALLTEKGYYNDLEIADINGLEDDFFGEVVGVTALDVVNFWATAPKGQQEQIQKNFTMIDFKNGDCFDFWNYLVAGFAQAHGYEYTYQRNPVTGKVGANQIFPHKIAA
jgi:hypothetical protein